MFDPLVPEALTPAQARKLGDSYAKAARQCYARAGRREEEERREAEFANMRARAAERGRLMVTTMERSLARGATLTAAIDEAALALNSDRGAIAYWWRLLDSRNKTIRRYRKWVRILRARQRGERASSIARREGMNPKAVLCARLHLTKPAGGDIGKAIVLLRREIARLSAPQRRARLRKTPPRRPLERADAFDSDEPIRAAINDYFVMIETCAACGEGLQIDWRTSADDVAVAERARDDCLWNEALALETLAIETPALSVLGVALKLRFLMAVLDGSSWGPAHERVLKAALADASRLCRARDGFKAAHLFGLEPGRESKAASDHR